jgi:hypothetical protein
MPKTTFILEADEAKAVGAFLKVVDAQNKSTDAMRKMGREGRDTQKSLDGFGKVASQIGMIAGGFIGATGAMEGARKVIRLLTGELVDLRRKETEAAQATMDYAKGFSEAIGDWLGPEKIDEAHAALTRLTKTIPELSFTAGKGILGAFGAAKPEAGLAEGLKAVQLAAPLAWGREQTAAFVGELSQLFPGKEMEDLFDIAIGLQKRAGKRKEELTEAMKGVHKITAMGIAPEQALGALMAAFEEEQAGRAVGTLATIPAYFGKKVKRVPGKKLTEEQRIQLETFGMTEGEIFKWALANPEAVKTVLKTTYATVAPMLKPGAIESWTKTVGTIQVENEYQKRIEAERESALAMTALISARREAAIEQLKIGYTSGGMVGFTRKATYDLLASMPGIGKTERNLILSTIGVKGRLSGEYAETAVERLGQLQQTFAAPTYKRLRTGIPWDFLSPILPPSAWTEERNPRYTPDMAEAIGGLVRDIREQATAFKEMDQLNQPAVLQDHTKALREHTAALKENTQTKKTTIYQSKPGPDE